jgi:hypothetical protein
MYKTFFSFSIRARLARTLKWARSVHFYCPLISGQVLIQLPFGNMYIVIANIDRWDAEKFAS